MTWHHLEELAAERARAVSLAEGMLACTLGVIEGSRLLQSVLRRLVPDVLLDEDARVLVALTSETDHLDVGVHRAAWNAEALAAQDREVARIEAEAEDDVLRVCRSVVSRFRPET